MTCRRQTEAREAGFLLIEVLMTAALLLVALLAVIPLLTLAMRQNAMAKDVTVASNLAGDKVEQFQRLPCSAVRRGSCCALTNPVPVGLSAGACGLDEITVDRIVYRRTCTIRQSVANTLYANDSDAAAHGFPVGGVAWIEVSVEPRRSKQLAARAIKPAVVSMWRVCEP